MKLTLPQEDIYFEQLLLPNEPIYNIGAKVHIEGIIDPESMNLAYKTLINQHDAYRSSITAVKEEVHVKMTEEYTEDLEFLDFSLEYDANNKALEFMEVNFKQPFNIESDVVLQKFILIKVSQSFYYLYSKYHHIITDGWGTSLMFQRLVENYNELIENGSVLSSYPFSYTDFVKDDKKYLQSEDYIKDKEYWKEQFSEIPEQLFEKYKDTALKNKSERETLIIKRDQYNELLALAKEYSSSTFHVILSLLFLHLARTKQRQDITIGIPVLNRSKSIFKKTVGLFMGVSVLRIRLDLESSFTSLLDQVRKQLRQDYRYQRFPLGKLINELGLVGNKDSLFNVTMSYEKQNYSSHFAGTKTTVIPLSHKSERVALALYVREFDELEDILIDFDYNLNYFNSNTIKSFVSGFESLVTQTIAKPNNGLKEFQCITVEEKKNLLGFNPKQSGRDDAQTLFQFIAKHVKRNPQKVALFDSKEKFTYQQLHILSDQIAKNILEMYPKSKTIGVLMNRSANMVVILLGIMKSKKAYIPLDPIFPEKRLNYIIKHSETDCIISDKNSESFKEIITITIDALLSIEKKMILPKIVGSDSAYIIYTSGSTGNPKGVEIGHASLLNFLRSMASKPGICKSDLMYSVTTQSFDISILEFFTPLITGGTCYVSLDEILSNPYEIIKDIEAIKPSVMQATPSFYQLLANAGWNGNKNLKVLCGGDLLSESLANYLLLSYKEVYNMYGPTETTIWSSYKKITKAKDANNIGAPINNTAIFILDNNLKLLPISSIGKLFIGGQGLAKGYFKDKEKTKSKFVLSPFKCGALLYDTGDLAKWTEKGELIFHGRSDNQVKVRGYRIELGDVESKLNELEVIESSVVLAREEKSQESSLIAYVIKKSEHYNEQDVLNKLALQLPKHMIPNYIVLVNNFPLTPNKKIDRNLLMKVKVVKDANFIELPVTELEHYLCATYQKILNLDSSIGVHASFFNLGGHSLNAVRLIHAIENDKKWQLSLKNIFDHSTVFQLANFINQSDLLHSINMPRAVIKEYYPLTNSQYEIWLASQDKYRSVSYNMHAIFTVEGEFSLDKMNDAFNRLINKHELLRTSFVLQEGMPYQIIRERNVLNFKIDKHKCDSDSLENLISSFQFAEFNFEKDKLIKVALIEEGNKTHFVFVTHHLIMDGVSLESFIKEFISEYQNVEAISTTSKPSEMFQFKDYSEWQISNLNKSETANTQFWNSFLKGYQWQEIITKDFDSNNTQNCNSYSFNIPSKVYIQIDELTQIFNISLHTLLLASFNLLLYKLYGAEDICVSTLNSGRNNSILDSKIGMFVKTLPIRSQINENELIEDFFLSVQETLLQMDAHQDIPSNIRKVIKTEILFGLEDEVFTDETIQLGNNLYLSKQKDIVRYGRVPFWITMSRTNDNIEGQVYYMKEFYDTSTIELIIEKYKKFLEVLIEKPLVKIKEVNIELGCEKKPTIDFEFNF